MSMRGRVQPAGGFTLLEMIVTISIFSILVALAVPTMRTWIANAKVRSVADALQNGIRLAQAESLRRSRQVVFALTTSTTPSSGFTASANGNNWAIAFVPALSGETGTFIQSGVLSLASDNVQITGPAAICFNSVGRLVANSSTGVTGGTCTAPPPPVNVTDPLKWSYDITLTGADRNLRVNVGLTGQTHLCDPSQALSNTNPYGCPP
jgi:type IV fimbrial biogenesis protein FimT